MPDLMLTPIAKLENVCQEYCCFALVPTLVCLPENREDPRMCPPSKTTTHGRYRVQNGTI
jgi:hypothetical protein